MLSPKEIVNKMINNDAFSKWLGINIIQLDKEQFSNVSSFSRDYIIKSFSKSQMVKNYFNLYEQESI